MKKRKGEGVKIKCKTCRKIFKVKAARKNEAKYCSKNCTYKSKDWKKKIRKIALEQLKKINAKWDKLKKDPELENCLIRKENEVLFDDLKWIKESNYIERIKLTPAIINILKFEPNEEEIFIKYKHFNPHHKEYRIYNRTIPRSFSFSDINFCYFLGLWIGDRLRVGISNSDKALLKYTKDFLENGLKQPIKIILGEILYDKKVEKHKIKEAEKFLRTIGITKIRKRIDKGGHLPNKIKPTLSYAILLSNNYILFHLLCYMERKLWECIKLMDLKARFSFYAGLIDAEGHIDQIHKTIDIFQNNKPFIDALAKQLKSEGFKVRADKKFARIYLSQQYKNNLMLANKLLPYLKHSEKVKSLPDLLNGNMVKKSYMLIVKWISLFPNRTTNEIALKFGQNERYFGYHKLTQLVNQKLIRRYKTEKKGKFRYAITEIGKEWIQTNKNFIEEKLKDIILNGNANYSMYYKNTKAIKEMIKENPSPAYSLIQTHCNS